MAGLFDWLFQPGKDQVTGTQKQQLPKWMDQAGRYNYGLATQLAGRAYTPYPFSRVQGFSRDQNKAMSMLRKFAPDARAGAKDFDAPRLIDNIGGKSGSLQAYMNPYLDEVLNRTEDRIDQGTGKALQWESNTAAHGANAFGDARHGIADSLIHEKGIQAKGDAAANAYAQSFDTAMQLRDRDINRMFDEEQLNMQKDDEFLKYIDSLYRSGANQQALGQKRKDLGYQDFVNQRDYPIDMFNLLQAALTGTPYSKTTQTLEPGPSNGGLIAGGIGSLLSMFL